MSDVVTIAITGFRECTEKWCEAARECEYRVGLQECADENVSKADAHSAARTLGAFLKL